ncbi:MAG TPA: endonuclease [Chitinophagaceae bacterium]|nr:endonuclease [Chitinophagaceae bacterium]
MIQYLKQLFFFCIIILAQSANAQYYNAAFGKNGTVLKTALYNIIKNHTVITYSDLWTAFYTTDNKGGNDVWDIYSDIPGGTPPYLYTLGTNQCGTYNSEGDCYNREHTWPSTYFGGVPPMYTDLQQIFPTDGWVNNKRGNFPYGKVNSVSWTSDNGSKTGTSTTYAGYTNDVFEPIDSFKGDLARVYFYMSTRYEGEDAGWTNWEMANGSILKSEAITLLLNWHQLDPVSQKEIDRNNAVFTIQGNRNPFIDYPQFAECIWGSADCSSLAVSNNTFNQDIQVYPNPSKTLIHIESKMKLEILSCHLYNLIGEKMIEQSNSNNTIHIEHLPNGAYYLLVNTNQGIAKKILIKE